MIQASRHPSQGSSPISQPPIQHHGSRFTVRGSRLTAHPLLGAEQQNFQLSVGTGGVAPFVPKGYPESDPERIALLSLTNSSNWSSGSGETTRRAHIPLHPGAKVSNTNSRVELTASWLTGWLAGFGKGMNGLDRERPFGKSLFSFLMVSW